MELAERGLVIVPDEPSRADFRWMFGDLLLDDSLHGTSARAVVQTTVFVVAGLTAAYRGFVDDRWARRMRRMMAEPASRAGGWRISRHEIT